MAGQRQGEWDGDLYAANSAHHRSTDDRLIADLDLRPDAVVVDLGCGHGDLTARLAALVPQGEVIGIDASADMIRTAASRHRAPNLRFVHAPVQDLSRVVEVGGVDAFLSVACLHWVPREEHPDVLRQIHDALRSGGVLRVDFGGRGQIAAPRVILEEESATRGGPTDPWYFPDVDEYRDVLVAAGFSLTDGHVRLRHERRSFPDSAALLGMLRSQVYVAYDGTMSPAERAEFHAAVDARAPRDLLRHDGTYDLDFVRMDLLARRR